MYIEDNEIETRITNKWYKVSVVNCDNSYYTEDFFGTWLEFRYSSRNMRDFKTKAVQDIDERVFDFIFWLNPTDEYDDDEYYKSQAEELKEKYYIYPVSVFEHSLFSFRLWVINEKYWIDGVILLEKENFDKNRATDEKKIDEFLRKDYTNFFNGRMYKIEIFEPHKWEDGKGNEMTTRDYVDGLGGIFEEDLNEDYKQNFEETYWTIETPF